MNANELVANAYYLSGIVGRELEEVSGSQQADGLRMLNRVLAKKSANAHRIPYYTHSSFDTAQGQEDYFVNGLVDTEAVTYNIGDVRWGMLRATRKKYFGSFRVDSIESLPGSYYPERCVGGTRIYFYDIPADIYDVKITGKFSFAQVTGGQDLSPPFLDNFYLDYLEYAVANRLCHFNDIEFAPGKMQELSEIEKDIFNVEPPDLTIKKISTIGPAVPANYAWANLSTGYVP